MKSKYFFCECRQGCTIRIASTLKMAEREFLKEVGTANYEDVREAEESDVNNVKGMGGYVPDLP